MVAYSFQPRFVVPVALGLGVAYPVDFIQAEDMGDNARPPKLQTIRADRLGSRGGRHARAGELVQLYYAQRSPRGFKIGDGRCVGSWPIVLRLLAGLVQSPALATPGHAGRIEGAAELDSFARSDGFADWAAMRVFWRETHETSIFSGVIVKWERIASP